MAQSSTSERQLLNLPEPHEKQQEVLLAKQNRIVLNWGRRCLVSGTLVAMADGSYMPIEEVKAGDYILSLNTDTKQTEVKQVEETHEFGAMQSPKPLVTLEVNGRTITSTYDHEYYVNDTWIPAIELAWGALAASEREKFQLLCKQYGTIIDDELQGRLSDQNNQASPRRLWVLEDSDGRQNNKGSSRRSRDVASESAEQTSSESHRQQSSEQSHRQSGMGDAGRELGAYDGAGTTEPQPRREVRGPQADRSSGASDTRLSGPAPDRLEAVDVAVSSREISRSKARLNSGRLEGKDLEVLAATVRHSQVTYDLTVADNHNYVAEGVLVHNTGKSKVSGIRTSMSAILEQGTYYIIAPTIGNAKKIYWDEVLKQIWKNSPLVDPKWVKANTNHEYPNEVGFNENELSVTIDYIENAKVVMPDGTIRHVSHDKSKPRSKIVLYGATEPDNILGIGLRGVVMDECAKMPNFWYVWRKVVRPMLGDYEGWAMFISTPLGIHNPWFEQVSIAKGKPEQYFFSHATAYDNPYFPDSEIEEARADAEYENDINTFEQEWLAQFVNPQGAIFPEFDPEKHTFDIKELPREGLHVMTVDFGFSPAPAAMLTILIDENNRWWIYDEMYGTELDDDRVANIIKNKMMDTKYDTIIGDGQRKDTIAFMRRVHRIPIMPSVKGKGSLMHGINLIHKMFRPNKQGEAQLMIARHLTNTIKEFQSYSRKRSASGDFFDIPEDDNNHAIDAIRYALARYLSDEGNKDRQRPATDDDEAQYSAITGRRLN